MVINFFTNLLNRKLFKSSSVYLFSSLINSLVPFLFLPILTTYLAPKDYGLVSMFMVLVSFVSPFTGLSVHAAVYKQFFVLEKIELSKYISNVLFILGFSIMFSFTFFYFSISFINNLTELPSFWIYLVLVVSTMNFISSILLSFWQVNVKPLYFGLFQIMSTLINIGISLFLVIYFNFSWEGRLYGIVIASILAGFVSIYLLIRYKLVSISFNKSYLKHSLKIGIPLIPTTMKDAIISISDKVFITGLIGTSATGLYAVGIQFSSPILLLSAAFNNAYVPLLFEKLKQNNNHVKEKIVKFTYYYFIIALLISFIWSFIGVKLLVLFLDKAYFSATMYIFWLSLGFAFSGMHSMVVNFIYYAEKTSQYGLLSIFNILLNITLNYYMIINFGSIGAAQATCLTYLLFFLATWWLSNKLYPMPWFKIRFK